MSAAEQLLDYDPSGLEDIAPIADIDVDDTQQKDAPQQKLSTGLYGVNCSNFKDMLLKSELNKAIQDCGFEHPSEVQQECIPQSVHGRDVLCQAVSGMGKTAVFIISILQQMQDDPKNNTALILCNVRELAYQIKKEVIRFTKHMPHIRSHVFFGGVPIKEDIAILEGKEAPHIVIGTPGRVLQLVNQGHMKLNDLRFFILDECDKMLDATDMRNQVQKIFMKGNANNRQVMMFSATLSDKTKEICSMFMKNPYKLFIDQESKLTLHGLSQYYVKLEDNKKVNKLIELLDCLDFNQVIIFTKEIKYAEILTDVLKKEQFPAKAVHGRMEMQNRLKVYDEFKKAMFRILVTTDIFGRGIDVEKINIVINFDMASESDQYLHRVGRAGRFGTKGLAISFISTDDDNKILDDVQNRFEVKIDDLPKSIDKATYMNN